MAAIIDRSSQNNDPAVLKGELLALLPQSDEILTVTKLAGDASSRSYYRIFTSQGRSWVLQKAEPFEDTGTRQHPFLCGLEILHRVGVPVPKCVGHDAARGWIVLSDLGDETLQSVEASDALYAQALDWLVAWTVHAEKSNPVLAPMVHAPQWSWAFDEAKFDFEAQHTDEHLFRRLLKRADADFRRKSWHNSLWLVRAPRAFCHRDYHARNVMVLNGQTHVIDFQDARLGPCTYDLVSLLWDPYAGLSPKRRQTLVDLWQTKLSDAFLKAGATARANAFLGDPLRLRQEMLRMTVQRLMKAAGSYASFWTLKGRKDYLQYIEPAVAGAKEALTALNESGLGSKEDQELLSLVDSTLELCSLDRMAL